MTGIHVAAFFGQAEFVQELLQNVITETIFELMYNSYITYQKVIYAIQTIINCLQVIPFNPIDQPIAAHRSPSQLLPIDGHRWISIMTQLVVALGSLLEMEISNFNQLTFPFQPI